MSTGLKPDGTEIMSHEKIKEIEFRHSARTGLDTYRSSARLQVLPPQAGASATRSRSMSPCSISPPFSSCSLADEDSSLDDASSFSSELDSCSSEESESASLETCSSSLALMRSRETQEKALGGVGIAFGSPAWRASCALLLLGLPTLYCHDECIESLFHSTQSWIRST